MQTDTLAFLDALFARSDPRAYLTITAIHPDGEHPVPSRHIRMDDVDARAEALERLTVANNYGWGAYFAVAPRLASLGRWQRGTKGDLAYLPALFVDIDSEHGALDRLRSFSRPPSCIVHSGHGYHAYWYLADPTADFDLAGRILNGLALGLGGDSHTSVAQSLRLPGSLNTKRQPFTPCRLLELDATRVYAIDDFRAYARSSEQPRAKLVHSGGSRTANWAALRRAITDFVMTVLDGYLKHNGWIAARCPCGHVHDSPGRHFNYHPASGVGYCFGKHGKLGLADMCYVSNIAH
jgi:hypothetical protein